MTHIVNNATNARHLGYTTNMKLNDGELIFEVIWSGSVGGWTHLLYRNRVGVTTMDRCDADTITSHGSVIQITSVDDGRIMGLRDGSGSDATA